MVNLIKIILSIICIGLINQADAQDFKFAFLTDMHISNQKSLNKVDSLLQTFDTDTELILTGGDNIDIDNLKKEQLAQGEKNYRGLISILEKTTKPFYLTIGNHDRQPNTLGVSNRFQLFEKIAGKTYQAIEHKGWKFIILNSVEVVDNKYAIDSIQINWLKKEIQNTKADQPIVIVSHVPFLSVYYPVLDGKYTDTDTFKNQKEVFDLFQNHNLKLVLQGHMHLYEEIKVKDVQFITAGAVSGNWWGGDYHGTKPGYLEVNIKGDNFSWTYKPL